MIISNIANTFHLLIRIICIASANIENYCTDTDTINQDLTSKIHTRCQIIEVFRLVVALPDIKGRSLKSLLIVITNY